MFFSLKDIVIFISYFFSNEQKIIQNFNNINKIFMDTLSQYVHISWYKHKRKHQRSYISIYFSNFIFLFRRLWA